MLGFDIMQAVSDMEVNRLNTSYVRVRCSLLGLSKHKKKGLNTSYVRVRWDSPERTTSMSSSLNTSYVRVRFVK